MCIDLQDCFLNKVLYLSKILFRLIGVCLLMDLILQYGDVSAKYFKKDPLPAKKQFHLFVLAGQSNMAGRGKIKEYDQQIPERVLKQDQSGNWIPAVAPIHYGKPITGVGPGRTFGITLAEYDSSITIGLIPCATGGSSIVFWKPGSFFEQTKSYPYDDCIKRVQQARKDGVLKAVLWHQGESDRNKKKASLYKKRLHELIARFRNDFKISDLPFIVGQLGNFKGRPWDRWCLMVDNAHQDLPNKIPHTACISSEGLEHKGDLVHFKTESARELGGRYARAYIKLWGFKKNNQ